MSHLYSLTALTTTIGYVIASLSLAFYVPYVWIVYRYSLREMGAYKWYLILWASGSTLVDVVFGLTHPQIETVDDVILITLRGPFEWSSGLHSVNEMFDAVLLLAFFCEYALLALFVFRYAQTVQSRVHHILSRLPHALGLFAAFMLMPVVAVIVPCHWFYVTLEDDTMRKYGYYNAVYIAYKTDSPLWRAPICTALAIVAASVVIVSACVWKCMDALRTASDHLSSRTLALYRMLLAVLLLDALLAGICLILPVVVIVCSLIFEWKQSEVAFELCAVVITVYAIISHAVTLYFIVPYRKAVIAFLRQCFRHFRRERINSIIVKVVWSQET